MGAKDKEKNAEGMAAAEARELALQCREMQEVGGVGVRERGPLWGLYFSVGSPVLSGRRRYQTR